MKISEAEEFSEDSLLAVKTTEYLDFTKSINQELSIPDQEQFQHLYFGPILSVLRHLIATWVHLIMFNMGLIYETIYQPINNPMQVRGKNNTSWKTG